MPSEAEILKDIDMRIEKEFPCGETFYKGGPKTHSQTCPGHYRAAARAMMLKYREAVLEEAARLAEQICELDYSTSPGQRCKEAIRALAVPTKD